MTKEINDKPDAYLLRMPGNLRARIQAAADNNGTTLKTEILRVLEQTFPSKGDVIYHLEEAVALLTDFKRLAQLGNDEANEVRLCINMIDQTIFRVITRMPSLYGVAEQSSEYIDSIDEIRREQAKKLTDVQRKLEEQTSDDHDTGKMFKLLDEANSIFEQLRTLRTFNDSDAEKIERSLREFQLMQLQLHTQAIKKSAERIENADPSSFRE